MNVISGLSKTADIEKTILRHPRPERSRRNFDKRKPLPPEWKESAFCIGCGGCILECPVYLEKGSVFGTHTTNRAASASYPRPSKRHSRGHEGRAFSCTTCGACVTNCPVGIDTPAIIKSLRKSAARSVDADVKRRLRPYRIVASSVIAMASRNKNIFAR